MAADMYGRQFVVACLLYPYMRRFMRFVHISVRELKIGCEAELHETKCLVYLNGGCYTHALSRTALPISLCYILRAHQRINASPERSIDCMVAVKRSFVPSCVLLGLVVVSKLSEFVLSRAE